MIFNDTFGASAKENATDISDGRSELSIILYGTFLSTILVLSLVGNLLVVIGVITIRQLKRDISNIFLVNLSITDMSNAVFVMSSSLIALSGGEWTMPQLWCKLQCALNYCFIIVSMLTLAMISIDRYHAVENSLKYSLIITKRRIHLMILYTWAQGLAFSIPPVILDWIEYDYEEIVCAIDWFKETDVLYYVIVANILCFLVPGAVLFYCYIAVGRTAQRLGKTAVPCTPNPTAQQQWNANRVFKSLVTVVVIFFICMTPFCITKLLKVVTGNPKFVPGYINTISTLLQHTASATNPFIYGIFRKDFQIGFKRLVKKFFCVYNQTDSDILYLTGYSSTARKRSKDVSQVL